MSQEYNWKEIIQKISIQLKERQGILAKRVIAASSVGLVALFFIVLGAELLRSGYISSHFSNSAPLLMVGATAMVVLSTIVTILLTARLDIEEVVWLDSFFDGEELSPKESMMIAKGLFWDWAYLRFKIFYRYYLWMVIVSIIVFTIWLQVFVFSGFKEVILLGIQIAISFIVFIGGGLLLVLLVRSTKIKTRYAPFLFLDRFNSRVKKSSTFWKDFFKDLESLNNIGGSEAFKKRLALGLGSDVAMQTIEGVADLVQMGVAIGTQKMPGILGPIVRAGTTTTVRAVAEVGHRNVHFAKLTLDSIFYRMASRELYGERVVNEYVYSLKESSD